MVVKK